MAASWRRPLGSTPLGEIGYHTNPQPRDDRPDPYTHCVVCDVELSSPTEDEPWCSAECAWRDLAEPTIQEFNSFGPSPGDVSGRVALSSAGRRSSGASALGAACDSADSSPGGPSVCDCAGGPAGRWAA